MHQFPSPRRSSHADQLRSAPYYSKFSDPPLSTKFLYFTDMFHAYLSYLLCSTHGARVDTCSAFMSNDELSYRTHNYWHKLIFQKYDPSSPFNLTSLPATSQTSTYEKSGTRACKHGTSDRCTSQQHLIERPQTMVDKPLVTLPFWGLSHLVRQLSSIHGNLKQGLVAGCPSWRQPIYSLRKDHSLRVREETHSRKPLNRRLSPPPPGKKIEAIVILQTSRETPERRNSFPDALYIYIAVLMRGNASSIRACPYMEASRDVPQT